MTSRKFEGHLENSLETFLKIFFLKFEGGRHLGFFDDDSKIFFWLGKKFRVDAILDFFDDVIIFFRLGKKFWGGRHLVFWEGIFFHPFFVSLRCEFWYWSVKKLKYALIGRIYLLTMVTQVCSRLRKLYVITSSIFSRQN